MYQTELERPTDDPQFAIRDVDIHALDGAHTLSTSVESVLFRSEGVVLPGEDECHIRKSR